MSMTSVFYTSLLQDLHHSLTPPLPFPMTRRRSNFYSTIYISLLFFDLRGVVLAEGFDSLLQLPHSRPFGNRRVSEKLLLHVGDHGALGDGFSDDTEVKVRFFLVIELLICIIKYCFLINYLPEDIIC